MLRRRRLLWAACATALLAGVGGIAIADVIPGQIGPALGITPNGRQLHPIGRLTQVGNFPTVSALTPDGHFMWVVDAGHGSNDVRVMNVATGQVVQTLPLPGAGGGIVFAPDGKRAYVSGTPKGSSPTLGPTKGNQGDAIHVFSVNRTTGRGVELNPVVLPQSSGGSGRTNSATPLSGPGTAFPEGLAISDDGRWLVAALNQADRAAIMDIKRGRTRLVSTGAYPVGAAFDHRGRAYVSNEYDGTVSVIDPARTRVVKTITGLGLPEGDRNSHPEGMTADPVRNAIYVAVTNRDRVATIDTKSLTVSARISVGRAEGVGTAPVSVATDPLGITLYAADSGEDAVAAISLTKRPGPRAAVTPKRLVVAPTIKRLSRFRALSLRAKRTAARAHGKRRKAVARKRYARTIKKLRKQYLRGPSKIACKGPTRKRESAYVKAVLGALDIKSAKQRKRALARAKRRLPRFALCTALPGYIPNLPKGTLIGRLPTGAYPVSVKITSNRQSMLWVAAKGAGTGPNPGFTSTGDTSPDGPPDQSPYGSYLLNLLLGTVGTLPAPSDQQMRAASPLADAAVRPINPQSAPAGTPVVGPGGGASGQIKHVFYIVRENRTYDQIFGSESRGDGAPALELFDDNGVPGPTGGVTPNAHALARDFPLIDHFYADSEVSVDGHLITSGGYATDYVQKALAANYSNRDRASDFGAFPVSFPPNDFIFDQAVRQGISFHDYGEVNAGNTPLGNDGRPTFTQVTASLDPDYPTNHMIGCANAAAASCSQDSGILNGQGKSVAGKSRFDIFKAQFDAQVATDSVPTLNYMVLPNDHTSGTTSGTFSPQAMVADNDLALGQIVDLISHSPIWGSSAIFVVEDDSQDGADHVDAHRMPAFVISPWAKQGAVVHTRYDQYSALHTMELIMGMHPLSLYDALATPMYDCFDASADVSGTRYTAIIPTQDIGEVNPTSAPSARLSAELPWHDLDLVPQALSDEILWHSVYGKNATPPSPGPSASPIEHARAVNAERLIRTGGNAKKYLRRTGGDDD
jgi:YVTN family beta-propeller protein